MVAGSWIHRHSLHNGQCLDGGISDAGKQRVPEGQVLGRHLIRGHQAALKVCPLVPDISDIQQCLSRQLPLDIQSPVLKIRRASIFTVEDVNTTVESDGWIDVRGFGNLSAGQPSSRTEAGVSPPSGELRALNALYPCI